MSAAPAPAPLPRFDLGAVTDGYGADRPDNGYITVGDEIDIDINGTGAGALAKRMAAALNAHNAMRAALDAAETILRYASARTAWGQRPT